MATIVKLYDGWLDLDSGRRFLMGNPLTIVEPTGNEQHIGHAEDITRICKTLEAMAEVSQARLTTTKTTAADEALRISRALGL